LRQGCGDSVSKLLLLGLLCAFYRAFDHGEVQMHELRWRSPGNAPLVFLKVIQASRGFRMKLRLSCLNSAAIAQTSLLTMARLRPYRAARAVSERPRVLGNPSAIDAPSCLFEVDDFDIVGHALIPQCYD
jgi:hypothetical protein